VAAGAFFAPLAGCAGLPGGGSGGGASSTGPSIGFKSLPVSAADRMQVAEGYSATVIAPWGEPIGVAGAAMPAFKPDASNSAADQVLQMGQHHDGLQFYALDGSSRRGLLAMNHEYTDDGLLHPGGMSNWSAEKVHKSQASHGISVIEVELKEGPGVPAGRWCAPAASPGASRRPRHLPSAARRPATP
jgi:secreted PhoX family phosphatase